MSAPFPMADESSATDRVGAGDDPLLRLTACPSCGYSLEALPLEGRCPECGAEYDQRTVVLHGWGAGFQADVATARPAVVVAWVAFGAWVVWDALRDSRHDPSGLLCAGLALAWLTTALWRRWGSDMPGLAQVRLNASGVCQVDATAAPARGPAWVAWATLTKVEVMPHGEGLVRLRAKRKPPWWRMEDAVVDAIVRCSPAQAAALREKIRAWRAAVGEDTAAGRRGEEATAVDGEETD